MMRYILSICLFLFGIVSPSAKEWSIDLNKLHDICGAIVNQPFSMSFSIVNSGTAPITDIDIEYSPNGGNISKVHHKFEQVINQGETKEFVVDGFVCDVQGAEVFGLFEMTNVNGEKNYGRDTYMYLLCAEELVPRRVVVETAVNVNCGYSPCGLVSMEHMRNKIKDGSWIGILVQKTGAMSVYDMYAPLWRRVLGTPQCFVNRQFDSDIYPSPVAFDGIYERNSVKYSVVSIEAESEYDPIGQVANINAKVRFVFNENGANYRLAYIITENNVGTYDQRNYYSGGAKGEMYGWENKAYYEPTMYNDVARRGSIYDGLNNSLPDIVDSDLIYAYEQELDLSYVESVDNSYVTVMVVDGITEEIMNAVRVPINGMSSGLKNVAESVNNDLSVMGCPGEIRMSRSVDVSVYTIDGRSVANKRNTMSVSVLPGLYIVVAENNVYKVAVY